MYRSALKTSVERPAAVRVPADEYISQLDKKLKRDAPLPRSLQTTYDHCSAEFSMFYLELMRAANDRGMLHNTTALDLWRVIERNVEVDDADTDDEART